MKLFAVEKPSAQQQGVQGGQRENSPQNPAMEKPSSPRMRRLKKPIRLIERAPIRAAGNYRTIPLATAQEVPLAERVSDILQKQTGIQLNRAGAPGSQSMLGLRGSNPDQVEYFLEGMPLPKPYNAPLNLETLPLPLFSAVEIFPSFVPSHLPATNIGGAMNFRIRESTTQNPEYLAQSFANSLLGSGIALARLSGAGIHYASLEQSRNRYYYLSDNGTPENASDDSRLVRENEDYSRLGYTFFQRYKSTAWKWTALADLNYTERGLPGVANQPLTAVRKRDERYAAAVAGQTAVGESQRIIFIGAATLEHSRVTDPKQELFFSRGQVSQAPQFLTGVSYALQSNQFDAALHLRGRYQNVVLNEALVAERRETQAALNLAWERRLFRLAAQAGGTLSRDEAAHNAFFASAVQSFVQNGVSASGLIALRPLELVNSSNGNAEATENIPEGRGGGGEGGELELYAQASSVYRPPSLYERFGDNVFVTPSESLRSESAITNAAGLRGSYSCMRPLVCSLRSEGFLTGAKDYILFTQNSARTLIAVNATSARILGLENEVLLNYPGYFLLTLRYTYLDARDYGRIPYYQDKFLPLRPRHHAVGTLTFFYEPVRFITSIEYRGALFRDRYNSYHYYLAAKFLLDVGIDWVWDKAAQHLFSFAVKNLLDDTQVDMIGYTLPGRFFLVKWTAQW